MTVVYRPKSFVELQANAFAVLSGVRNGEENDLNRGAWIRTIIEAFTLADADQHIQINGLLKFFTLDRCKGDDLDRRALDLGTLFRVELRRRQAQGSVVKVAFGDGTQIVTSRLAADAFALDTTLSLAVDTGDDFPSSGALDVERGTARYERVVYTRIGDVLTVPAGLTYAHAAYGEVARVSTQSTLAGSTIIGATTGALLTGTDDAWPLSGSVVIGRGLVNRELLTFTRSGVTLTFGSGALYAHTAGESLILSTNGSDRVVSVGTQVYVQATETSAQVSFQTLAAATVFDGDFYANLVDAKCLVVGDDTNVGANQVRGLSSPPFSGAVVTNPLPASGGRSREDDDHYLARLKDFINAWGGRSGISIEQAVVGLFDEVTNRRVAFAQVIDPVVPADPALLYITDGSASFAVDFQVFTDRDVVISDATFGDARGRFANFAPYQILADGPYATRTPRLYASVQRGTASSVGVDYLEDSTQNMVTDAYVNMYLKTIDDQFFQITGNSAIRFDVDAGGGIPLLSSYAVVDFSAFSVSSSAYVDSTSTATAANTLTDASLTMTVNEHADRVLLDANENLWTIVSNTATIFTLDAGGVTPAAGAYRVLHSARSLPLVLGEDYAFNESTGDLELVDVVLEQHDAVVAAPDGVSPSVGSYTYATGLAALAQRVVNGDPTDFENFPCVKSHGAKILVVAPTVVSPTFVISVVPKSGVSVSSLFDLVASIVRAYVNSLGVGEEVIRSEIIKLVKLTPGVADVDVVQPTNNVPVADGQLARITEADVEVV